MTLVEVTIASVIFAMIMAAVVTALRTFGQTYERLQLVTDQTSQKREVDRFLRYAFEDALAEPGYFDGSGTEVTWVAPIDRAGSAGGLQHLRLEQSGRSALAHFCSF
jgi:Tfp pilus assembly protein PilV